MSLTFTIEQPNGRSIRHQIEEGSTLFAGTGSQCKVALSGPDAKEIHCMIRCVDGQLMIQDWNSGGKTWLNGQPISDEVSLGAFDEVQFGEQIMRCGSDETAEEPHSAIPVIDPRLLSLNLRLPGGEGQGKTTDKHALPLGEGHGEATDKHALPLEESQGETTEKLPLPLGEGGGEGRRDDDLLNELQRVHADTTRLNDSLDTFADADPFDSPDDDLDADPFGGGDYQLLRAEVEHLQAELNDKDQQIISLQQQLESAGTFADTDVDHADTERLVTRMEELLDELQSTDDRVRTLEELLRASDEATQAEMEERQQLESWVNQIERRIADREQDATAEAKRLSQRVRELVAQQKQNEQVLERALNERRANVTDDAASSELLQTLTTQVQQLQTAWKEAQAENDRLSGVLKSYENIPDGSPEAYGMLQQKVMQLEIDLSRERAEIARERSNLMRAQSEMEQQSRDRGETDGADARFKAVREQLRERHAEEAVERESRRSASLGGRIARLFSRVEGV